MAFVGATPASADDAPIVVAQVDGSGSSSPDAVSGPGSSAPADAAIADAGSGSAIDAGSAAISPALPVVDKDDTTLAEELYRGITEKNWFLALGCALALLTHGVRWLLKKKSPKWAQDRWGYLLAAGMAGIVALSLAWMADASASSSDTWLGALKLFAASVLAYITSKKLVAPADTTSA